MAAEIAELGTSVDHILILLLGAMKRSPRRDVLSIEKELSVYDYKEYVIVKTPRESIYDMLPEGLFHHPSAHRTANTKTEIIKAIRQRKTEEQHARKFFLPFEASINHLRIEMALYENRLDKRAYYDDLSIIFSSHWEIFQFLDTRQTNIFLHLIPILHDIRDNHPVIETILNEIFLLPVQLILQIRLPVRPPEPIISMLGDTGLGVNLTTGNEIYDEGVDEILITIGPISNEVFQDFRVGGTRHKILELLSDYLLPVHMDVVIEFKLDDSDRFTRLAESSSYLNSVLGADTYL